MQNQILTSNFESTVFDLLKNYDTKEFNLMISGGSLLKCFSEERYLALDTSKWNVFFADERCNKDFLNFQDAKEFLKQIKGKVFEIKIMDSLEESVKRYSEILSKEGKSIDLCLLGVGENGHICSLWPESKSLETKELVELVTVDCSSSPKRITVTLAFINKCVKRLFFVIPPRNGIPKKVKEPHPSIKEKLKIKFTVILPENK